jgi:hypothetical protein
MKECLNCKTPYEAKRESSKFCSTNCRVMWNRKNPKNVITKVQAQVLYNEMMAFFRNQESTKKELSEPKQIASWELSTLKEATKEKTFQQHMNDLPNLETEYDYRTKAAEIEASSLSRKNKDLLLQNMRSSKL